MLGSVNSNNEYSFTRLDEQFTDSRTSNVVVGQIGRAFGAKNPYEKENVVLNKDKEKNPDNVLNFEDEAKKDKIKEKFEEQRNILEEKREKLKEQYDAMNEDENADIPGISYGSDWSSLTRSFTSLAAAVSSNDDRVTKSQLESLLQRLSAKGSSDDFKDEIAFIKNLIAKFDIISKDKGYITSFSGVNDIQDYKTVTKEQVTSPIDLRI